MSPVCVGSSGRRGRGWGNGEESKSSEFVPLKLVGDDRVVCSGFPPESKVPSVGESKLPTGVSGEGACRADGRDAPRPVHRASQGLEHTDLSLQGRDDVTGYVYLHGPDMWVGGDPASLSTERHGFSSHASLLCSDANAVMQLHSKLACGSECVTVGFLEWAHDQNRRSAPGPDRFRCGSQGVNSSASPAFWDRYSEAERRFHIPALKRSERQHKLPPDDLLKEKEEEESVSSCLGVQEWKMISMDQG
ncbi:unnamed protein product [Pleuronectes platessa]|uniref:Uncharacterized protein n=1 Tax=Pleuronectes platessa TaxID=8262 RepID=A0A9N7UQF5_PLEPL|nr:unnamed protein product [Pleuronectes platessa]